MKDSYETYTKSIDGLADLMAAGVDFNKVTVTLYHGTVHLTAWHYEQTKSSLQTLKKVFGPLEAVMYGEKVSHHKGTSKTGAELTYYGLYECKVERYEKQTVEVPAVEAQPAKVETVEKPVYYCGPAALPKD